MLSYQNAKMCKTWPGRTLLNKLIANLESEQSVMRDKKTIVYGLHAVKMLLQHCPDFIRQLWVQAQRQDIVLQELLQQARAISITVQIVPKVELDRLTENAVHQGIVALCKNVAEHSELDLQELVARLNKPALLLVLDGVQDPHNLGACLRSANALGVHAVIVPKDRAVGITPVVRKVASGAAEFTPLISVTNLARTLRWLKEQGIWLYGADETATQKLFEIDFTGPSALVLGSEGKGLRRLTRESCDALVQIPAAGIIGSLNVSVATGICLYEVARQRLLNT
jgi:23S rRNA (guanosine2251-2'-O)-methyltransferase